MEVAKLLVRMETRGYCMSVLRKKLYRHVHRFYYFIGEGSPRRLLDDIWAMVDALQILRYQGDDWEHQRPADSESEEIELITDDGSDVAVTDQSELEEVEA
jgi:hypothetical protein